MASTSVSSIQNSFKYEVFLSFRGEDTRKNFVDHLYHALTQKGIVTYKDDENIKQGNMISDELIKAIEDSKFYIIIFSKNYASSSWCLQELAKIMECQKMDEHTAYPVFYDVEPTEVRKQSGSVGDAFAKHKDEKDARKWREALKEASDLAGFELKSIANGHEAKFIEEIVKKISVQLSFMSSSIDGNLIGMEPRVNEVISSLELGVGDVRMLGIWGMGGAGKTTLAKAIFDKISIKFEGRSFIKNVREVSKASSEGLEKLQKQVLKDVSGIEVSIVSGSMMQRRMRGRKILVVLDDVDDKNQLEALAGDCNWFKPGSRVIITTRDKQVLVAHGVRSIKAKLLSQAEAGHLFSRYAFGRKDPIQGYEELSGKVLQYADGLPLTIKVMGSHLRGLDEHGWKDYIERLKKIPFKDTMDVLKISFDGLEDDHKEIFLDVACILKGWLKEDAIRVLESRGFYAEYGLRVLGHKSLITISEYWPTLEMHDHLEEMGRNIVRRLHPDEPNKHSRLWIDEEIKDILANDMGTQETKCLYLRISSNSRAEIAVKGLAKMKALRFIHIEDCFPRNIVQSDEVSEYLPNSLQYIRWDRFPLSSLPNTFKEKYLVGIELNDSDIVQLWEDGEGKVLHKLRFLRIGYSKLRTFDLRLAPNLEQLTIYYCKDFRELQMPAGSTKLKEINLSHSKLKNLHLGNYPNLEALILDGCSVLVELQMPAESTKLKVIDLSHSKLKNLHLGNSPNLEELILIGCNELVELQMPAGSTKLKVIVLSDSKLKNLHLGNYPNLEQLILNGCNELVELQMPAESTKLKKINLSDSKLKNLHLGNYPNLEQLILNGCNELVELKMPDDSLKLQHFKLCHSKLKTLHFGSTQNLKTLVLEGCKDLVELQMRVESLNLKYLKISHTKLKTLDLGLTPNLEYLDLENCYDLVEINTPIGCGRFKSFKFDKLNKALSELRLIAEPTDVCPLHSDNDSPKFRFECYYKEDYYSSFGNLERLISIGLCACTNLGSFSRSICGLRGLRKLTLEGSIPEVPRDLDQLECLEELIFSCTNIRNLPDSICNLKHLKSLELQSCLLLEKLPDDLGRINTLEMLIITDCNHLRDIPNNMGKIKSVISP